MNPAGLVNRSPFTSFGPEVVSSRAEEQHVVPSSLPRGAGRQVPATIPKAAATRPLCQRAWGRRAGGPRVETPQSPSSRGTVTAVPPCCRAGIKADAQRAKETGDTYNPNGVGAAWSHNFLNQKPWHPLSFRNQKARFEAEERAFKEAKTNQQAQVRIPSRQHAPGQSLRAQRAPDGPRMTLFPRVLGGLSREPGASAGMPCSPTKVASSAKHSVPAVPWRCLAERV